MNILPQTVTFDALPSDTFSVITSFLQDGYDICNLWFCGNKRLNTALGACGGIIKIHFKNQIQKSCISNRLPWPPLIFKFDKLQELSIKFVIENTTPDIGTMSILPSSLKRLTVTGEDKLTDSCIRHVPKGLLYLDLSRNKNLTDACIPHLPKGLLHLDLGSKNLTDACIPLLPKGLLHLNLCSCIPHPPNRNNSFELA